MAQAHEEKSISSIQRLSANATHTFFIRNNNERLTASKCREDSVEKPKYCRSKMVHCRNSNRFGQPLANRHAHIMPKEYKRILVKEKHVIK